MRLKDFLKTKILSICNTSNSIANGESQIENCENDVAQFCMWDENSIAKTGKKRLNFIVQAMYV